MYASTELKFFKYVTIVDGKGHVVERMKGEVG